MDEAEARSLLERLARHGPPTAQVAAIKVLLQMDKEAAEAAKEPERTQFDEAGLYDFEVPKLSERRINRKTGKATSLVGVSVLLRQTDGFAKESVFKKSVSIEARPNGRLARPA